MNVRHSLMGKARTIKGETEMMDSGDILHGEYVSVVLLDNV